MSEWSLLQKTITSQKIWGAVFRAINALGEPSLDWPNSKYILYTLNKEKQERTKIVGYVQFKIPVQLEEWKVLDPTLRWEKQNFSSTTCMNFINTINLRENGELKLL